MPQFSIFGTQSREFRWAVACFITMAIMCVVLATFVLIVRSESFTQSCVAVQNNNQKFLDFLELSETKAFKRMKAEAAEGKEPLYDRSEIAEAYDPLIVNIQPVNC